MVTDNTNRHGPTTLPKTLEILLLVQRVVEIVDVVSCTSSRLTEAFSDAITSDHWRRKQTLS